MTPFRKLITGRAVDTSICNGELSGSLDKQTRWASARQIEPFHIDHLCHTPGKIWQAKTLLELNLILVNVQQHLIFCWCIYTNYSIIMHIHVIIIEYAIAVAIIIV